MVDVPQSPMRRVADGVRAGDTAAVKDGFTAGVESTKQAAQKSWPHTVAWTSIALLLMKARPLELGLGVATGAALNLMPKDKVPYQDKVTDYASRFTQMFEDDKALFILGQAAFVTGLMNVLPDLKGLLPFGTARVFSMAVPLAAGLKMGDHFTTETEGDDDNNASGDVVASAPASPPPQRQVSGAAGGDDNTSEFEKVDLSD